MIKRWLCRLFEEADLRLSYPGGTESRSPQVQEVVRETKRRAWNSGEVIGQRKALSRWEVFRIRRYLCRHSKARDLALLNLGLSTALRTGDLLMLRCRHLTFGDGRFRNSINLRQEKTDGAAAILFGRRAQRSVFLWLQQRSRHHPDEFVFPGHNVDGHLSSRQEGRLVKEWVTAIGLPPDDYGTHSLRRTKAQWVFRRTKDIAVVTKLLGHASVESTYAYVQPDLDAALTASNRYDF